MKVELSSSFFVQIFLSLICLTILGCEDNVVDPSLPLDRIGDRWLESEMFNPELIKKYKIVALKIEDCQGASCYKDSIRFNSLGKISYDQPRIGTTYSYEYDEQGRVRRAIEYGGESLIEYTYLKNDSVIEQYFEIFTDSTKRILAQAKFKLARRFRERAVYDKKGRIVEDMIVDLMFPCAVISEGQNFIKYDYFKNELLKSIRCYNSSNELISHDVFYYMGEDGRVLEME